MSERNRPIHLPSVLYLQPTGEQLVEFCGSSRCAISHAHFFKIILSPGVWTGIPPRWLSDCTTISGLVSLTGLRARSGYSFGSMEWIGCCNLKGAHSAREMVMVFKWCWLPVIQGFDPDFGFWKEFHSVLSYRHRTFIIAKTLHCIKKIIQEFSGNK